MYSGPAYGLFTSPNPFSSAPAGSLKVADNVFFTAPSVLEPRRGMSEMPLSTFGSAGSRADTLAYYGESLVVAFDSDTMAIKTNETPFVEWQASFESPGLYRVPFQTAARSLFFSTSTGVFVFDGPPAEGYVVPAFDGGKAVAYDGATGTLSAGAVVTGGTSAATGTLTLRTGTATGVLYLKDVTGTFIDNEAITGAASFAGLVNGAPTNAVLVTTALTTATLAVNKHLRGAFTTATATISAIATTGIYTALTLTDIGPIPTATFDASEAVVVTEAAYSEPRLAGNPQGLDITAAMAAADGWQSNDCAVAYRFTICSKDRFGRIVEGPPSGRVTFRNPPITSAIGGLTQAGATTTVTVTTDAPHDLQAGDAFTLTPGEVNYDAGAYTVVAVLSPTSFTFESIYTGPLAPSTLAQNIVVVMDVLVTCYLPVDAIGNPVTTANFLRVYRSLETVGAEVLPADELFQCYESAYLTATDIAAGLVAFEDVTPEGALGQPLYTNPNTGEGALTANYQPPEAEDLAYFAGRMWFANTTNKQSLRLALIGVGAPDGIQVDDLFGIESFNVLPYPGITYYTAIAAGGTPGAAEFEVFTDGTPGQNIERTAKSLCLSINQLSGDATYAYYVSAEGGIPGQILLAAKDFGTDFAVRAYSTRATAWTPQLPDPTAPLWPAAQSDDNRHPAGLWYSKLAQPEAVPAVNYLLVDADNDAILKICPLSYRLIIFKTSGVFFCSNTEPFSIQKLSESRLLAPDSVQVLGERIYALTDQGILVVSDSGVVAASIPIDDTLTQMMGPASLATLKVRTVAIAYRSAQQYLCWVVEADEDGDFGTDNAQAFVFSTLSSGYTRYPFGARAAAVDSLTDTLVVAPTDDNALWQENKTYTEEDFVDLTVGTGTLVAVTDDVLELASVAGMEAGDVIVANGDTYLVMSVDTAATTVTTFGAPIGWEVGDAYDVKQAIECTVTFNDLTEGKPATMKMTEQCSLLFRRNGVYETQAAFASEITPAPQEVTVTADAWGTFAWGEVPYGGMPKRINRIQPLPVGAGNCCQLSVGFSTRQARARFEFLGLDAVSKKDREANYG